MEKLKQFLKKILPMSYFRHDQKMNELKACISALEAQQGKKLDELQKLQQRSQGRVSELIWAEVFHDTIQNSVWLTDPSFSPGRWAAGYPLMYVLYRILNEIKPTSILELGLGQSSKMIAQYAAANSEIDYSIVEHDSDWVLFFSANQTLPFASHLIMLQLTMQPYQEAEHVRSYQDFGKQFSGRRFDLVLIDAPQGGDMKEYSRIDMLELIPQSLAERFIIILDDTNRSGERNTARAISKKLEDARIEHCSSVYAGEKQFTVWCSKDVRFLCSM